MANFILDFLQDSLLFNENNINNNYKSITEKELKSELKIYREAALNNLGITLYVLRRAINSFNITIESLDYLPDESLLKQLALYIDKVIITDPILNIRRK